MYKSFSNSKKQQQRSASSHLTVKIPMILPDDVSEKVENEIFDVLENTRFNKIPMQLSAYRRDLGNAYQGNEDKSISIGYIKSFHPGDENTDASFTVIIFGKYADSVKDFINPAVEVVYIDRNDELTTITKFNIIPLGPDAYGADPDEEEETSKPATQAAKPADSSKAQPKPAPKGDDGDRLTMPMAEHLAEKEVPDIS